MAVLVPAGGATTGVAAEPPGCVETEKELLLAVPEEQPYVMARLMPTSATLGSQEIVAVGALVVLGIHCQPTMQAPL